MLIAEANLPPARLLRGVGGGRAASNHKEGRRGGKEGKGRSERNLILIAAIHPASEIFTRANSRRFWIEYQKKRYLCCLLQTLFSRTCPPASPPRVRRLARWR